MSAFTKIMLGATICASFAVSAPTFATPAPTGTSFKTSFTIGGLATATPAGSGIGSFATTLTPNAPTNIQNLTFTTAAAGANGNTITFSPAGFSATGPAASFFSWGPNSIYSFTSLTDTYTSGPASVNHLFTGTFADSSGVLATQTADFAIGFQQVGTIVFAGVFDTPNALPEPASMMILGLGLAGLVVARRRA